MPLLIGTGGNVGAKVQLLLYAYTQKLKYLGAKGSNKGGNNWHYWEF